MKFKSPVYSTVSGSVAGLTYARARGGILYSRARAMPVNPNSPRQQTVRNALASVSQSWITTTAAQKTSWAQYADQVQVIDKLGDPIKLSGQGMFNRCNSPRLGAASYYTQTADPEGLVSDLGLVLTGPSTPDLGELGTPEPGTFDLNPADLLLRIPFQDAPEWSTTSGAILLVQAGPPVSAGVDFFAGPFRQWYGADGLAAGVAIISADPSVPDPPTPYTYQAGQRFWCRMRATYPDGRLSAAAIVGPFTVIDTTP